MQPTPIYQPANLNPAYHLRFTAISLRSLGDATREAVEKYVRQQVERAHLVDPAYREQLRRCTWHDCAADLSKPSKSSSAL